VLRRRAAVAFVAILASILSVGMAWASSNPSAGHVRAVVVFLGDSNDVIAATQTDAALLDRDNGYAVVNIARPGSVAREPDCPGHAVPCATYDYWQARVADMRAAVQPDAYVIDLGINDTKVPGTATTPGYAGYAAKIDWLLASLGDVPVTWSTLPCKIEPPRRTKGCVAVNSALSSARARHRNLVLMGWAAVANKHRNYLGSSGTFNAVHLTLSGADAYAKLVAKTLDAHFAST
jgi:hypothetical protein